MRTSSIDPIDQIDEASGLALAPKTRRFFNFIVDYYCCSFIVALLEIRNLLSVEAYEPNNRASSLLIFLTIYFFYYLLLEFFLNGKTLGKFLTGTRAVTKDGEALTFRAALIRSLYRLTSILDLLTFIGAYKRGGHDIVSGTSVILDRK